MQTSEQPRSGHVVIGVDTHKHVHVAAVMDTIGGILATLTIPTDTGGFQQLQDWAASFGRVLAFGIEGTGSYGATLTSFLRRQGFRRRPRHPMVAFCRSRRKLLRRHRAGRAVRGSR
ncbi:transposase [Streptomyces sp. NPDC051014]|uniref:IS110 family transposase n=1 Tax=Streptomyces sp. NPDC051014 TaxID=3155751 RepID=UPI0033D52D43